VKSSFAQHDLHAEPDGPHQSGRNHGDNSLKGVTLSLLHALSPSSKVLEISLQLRTGSCVHSDHDGGIKKPAAEFPRGLNDNFDDAIVPVFCPTCQNLFWMPTMLVSKSELWLCELNMSKSLKPHRFRRFRRERIFSRTIK
jgi:hypothetical protein